MKYGMLAAGALSLLLRMLFRKGSLSPAKLSLWLLALSNLPSIFLSRYLERIGSPRRDATTDTLISAGEDLGRPGIIEWAFDVIYITCEYTSMHVFTCNHVLYVFCRGMSSRQRCVRRLVLVAISGCEFSAF